MKLFYQLSLSSLILGSLFLTVPKVAAQTQANAPKQTTAIPSFAEPAISPDGKEIAFVSGGDIWTVPVSGGTASLLISHADNEARPVYSPEGGFLAFTSNRSGNGDVYVLALASGVLQRLTYDDGYDEVSSWSKDGKYVYFSTSSQEIAGMSDIFRVKVTGGTPMAVTNDRYTNEFFAAPAPDGNIMAFNARGIASRQWWRNGHSHIDESEIWLRRENNAQYERITEGGAKELWPMWSPDGQSLYYVSDKSGAQNLWVKSLNGVAKKLTGFEKGRVLWPTLAQDGKTLVFERDFGIWKYVIATGQAMPVNITKRGVASGPATEHVRLTNQFRELTLSPDGKKLAFIVHGELFAASAQDGGDAMRITNTAANESQPVWMPNSNGLVYVSERDGKAHLYQYNFTTRTEKRLTNEDHDDTAPLFSPDGNQLAFSRDGKELRVLDLKSKKEKLVAKGYLGRPPFAASGSVAWSPDGKWLAFASFGAKSFRNISVVPASGGEAKPISFLANTFGSNVSWSPDGRYILFNTLQRTENGQIARIDLVPQTPRFREDQFRELFQEELPKPNTPLNIIPARNRSARTNARPDTIMTTTAKKGRPNPKEVKVVFADIRQRLSLLPVGVDVDEQLISRDGKFLLMIGTLAGQRNLYTFSLDEMAREPAVAKQLTSTSGYKSDPQFSPDGKTVYYLEQGRVQSIALDSRQVKPLAVAAEMDLDFAREKVAMFRQAWEVQNKGFYDDQFHGVDWQAVRTTYEPLAAGAHTPDELRRLLNLMVGELNASHSGVAGPTAPEYTTGRIGLRFDRPEYEKTGKLKITEVVAMSPAALSGDIKPGYYLWAVNDTVITPTKNLDQILENKINRRITLTVSATASGKNQQEIAVRPVNQTTEKGLLYKQWVQQQRDYVAKVSKGRLGYVHMFDMSENSLNQFYLDLDAENHAREGVVVDVRNNNGGFVNAYALDVLSRKGYMTMTVRGLPEAPARSQLGQRALEAPTILVTNQHSLSDAEDFTEGYQTLQLGKTVGEPTAGWIIYTSSAQLLDGSTIRLPFIKVTDHTGKNMELAPRPVDVKVSRPLGETYTQKDSQLDAAVKELLQQLDTAKSARKNAEVGSNGK